MDFRVELDVFHGPFDLLLYLVQREELDVFDIPISRITQHYLECMQQMQLINVELAGEFLVMASTLMEIKSRMLLPRTNAADEAEEADPRLELVRQLLEYKKFRNAAIRLQDLVRDQQRRYPRAVVEPPAAEDPGEAVIRDVELWDLVSAFGRLMRETLALAPTSITYDETPIETYMERIVRLLAEQGQLAFSELLSGAPRGRVLAMFLAILELVKTKQVRAEQNELFGEIWILPPEPSPSEAAAEGVAVV
jgi:segregation and condensation protein A